MTDSIPETKLAAIRRAKYEARQIVLDLEAALGVEAAFPAALRAMQLHDALAAMEREMGEGA